MMITLLLLRSWRGHDSSKFIEVDLGYSVANAISIYLSSWETGVRLVNKGQDRLLDKIDELWMLWWSQVASEWFWAKYFAFCKEEDDIKEFKHIDLSIGYIGIGYLMRSLGLLVTKLMWLFELRRKSMSISV